MPEARPPRGRVLVVEDEAYVRRSLGELLGARGFDVEVAESVTQAMNALARLPVDVVLTDLRMPAVTGLDLVHRVQGASPDVPVVILTGHGTIASAVECVRAGASDYILKPADPDALEVALDRALATRALKREVDYLRGGADDPDVPVGESRPWLEVVRLARAAAQSDAGVLLLGESGTGKELVARMIHRLSPRATGPYVRVNCAATPLEMWESEFFGHRKGSFTGAVADREGRFRLAHRGTLFMDEVGAMPLQAQAKILRVLQDGEFDRLGDERPTRVDVRIVAATNSDLDAEVRAGGFRQDLFYRLNVLRIDLPPLRSRPEDVPLLTERFVRRIAARLGRPAPAVGPGALEALASYSWPGNVRELQNVLERALILAPGDRLDRIELPRPGTPPGPAAADGAGSPRERGAWGGAAGGGPPGGGPEVGGAPGGAGELNLRAALLRREREAVLEALRRARGVRKEAARLLGIDQRNLAYYFRKHAIDPDEAGR
jgi:DNA-binding NtrC family response regulator